MLQTQAKVGFIICPKCQNEIPVSEYTESKLRNGMYTCKPCKKLYETERMNKPGARERHRKYKKEYDLTNKKRIQKYHQAYGKEYRKYNKEKAAANRAVHKAIRLKVLPKPSVHQCSSPTCEKQAELYHHESYAKKDWLEVTPFCRSCHLLYHYSQG